jgi:hypothetical protein
VRAACSIGDAAGWDTGHPLAPVGTSGVWAGVVGHARIGQRYKFRITGADGIVTDRADPLARAGEGSPDHASLIAGDEYRWSDAPWMEQRADRQRPDRYATRHLGNGKQAIHTFQCMAFDRHPQHRQRGHAGGHPGQMRRAAGAGDDDLKAPVARAFGVIDQPPWRAMRRDDSGFARNAQRVQDLHRVAHGLPVGAATHDDADQRRGGVRR